MQHRDTDSAGDELASFLRARLEQRRQRELAPPSLAQMRQQYDELNARIPLPTGCACLPVKSPGGAGDCLVPQDARPGQALLFHHGGGQVFGSPLSHRHLVARLARAGGVQAFNLPYRLAPEHPFPAGLDDVVANYAWLLEQGFDARQVIVAGDSAGGGLTAALALSLRRAGLPLPAGMYLLSPWLDLDPARTFAATQAEKDVVLTPKFLHDCAIAYARPPASFADERVSPLRGDLRGLCPLFIQVGSHDLLLDDSLRFAAKAADADVRVDLRVWPRAPHVWPMFHTSLTEWGRAAIDEAAAWMQWCLSGETTKPGA